MNNQKEIYEALLAGETLINVKFNKVKMIDSFIYNERNEGINPNFINPNVWQIYKEPEWHENIPDGGVLCWCKDLESEKEVIDQIRSEGANNGYYSSSYKHWCYAKPLTKREIQTFVDNAPEEV